MHIICCGIDFASKNTSCAKRWMDGGAGRSAKRERAKIVLEGGSVAGLNRELFLIGSRTC
eukprot:scaffold4474_cov94-Skeletonema_marinoi.AAC.3